MMKLGLRAYLVLDPLLKQWIDRSCPRPGLVKRFARPDTLTECAAEKPK
jgi:hypothetical protein